MGKPDDLFGQVLSHGPSQSTLLLILRKMKQEGRLSEVIQECLKAVGYYPEDIQLKMLLAESYLAEGQMSQAEAVLQKVTSDIGNLIYAYKLQAKIYVEQKRVEEGFEALKRYLAHNPDDQEALDLLEAIKPAEEEKGITAFEEEAIAKAQVPFEEAARIATEDTSLDMATPTLAEIYYNQGQVYEAISTYEKVLSNDPGDKASIKRLAELKASIAEETEPQPSDEDIAKAKKEKMIAILEGWLGNIGALKHA